MTTGPIAVALDVARTLDALGIPYVLGGSLASSIMGEPRSTVDIDMAVRLDSVSLEPLLEATRTEFYVPEDAARSATEAASSFNMVHRAGALKVDLFVLGDGVLDRRQLARRVRMVVSVDPASELWVTSAEDQVLANSSGIDPVVVSRTGSGAMSSGSCRCNRGGSTSGI